ncbi:MAG: hypothetical protein DRJ52_04210 [Thermoprotei archaeon]|nr:MAG: hypothetical protein DRJ52_04210 [Thermoprotei archaeon]
MNTNPYTSKSLLKKVCSKVVGRKTEITAIISALAAGRNVLLEGPPGTSKSTILKTIAENCGIAFYIVEGSSDLTPQKLVGVFNPAKVMAEGFKPEYFEPGPLLKAMKEGGILYIEEFNRMSEEAANTLIRAAEDREIAVPRLGVIRAKPSFRIICAMNPYDDVGTRRVSRALLDRFVRIKMDYQSREEEIKIVKLRTGSRNLPLIELAVDIARESRRHPAVKMGSSVRGAIDMVLLAENIENIKGELSVDDLLLAAKMAFTTKIWLRDTSRTPDEVVEEIFWKVVGSRKQSIVPLSRVSEGSSGKEKKHSVDVGDLERLSDMAQVAPRRTALILSSDEKLLENMESLGLRGLDTLAKVYFFLSYDSREIARKIGTYLVIRFAEQCTLGMRGFTRTSSWSDFSDLDVESTVEKILEKPGVDYDTFVFYSKKRRGKAYALIIDRSFSMSGLRLFLAALIAASLVYAEREVDDFSVLAFNTKIDLLKNFDEKLLAETLIDSILSLTACGYTDIHKALTEAYNLLNSRGYEPKAILVTDAEWTAGENPLKAAKLYKTLHVVAVPSKWIGFGEALARLGGGKFVLIRSVDEIADKLSLLLS